MYFDLLKLPLPGAILFWQLLPKLGSQVYYNVCFSFDVGTKAADANQLLVIMWVLTAGDDDSAKGIFSENLNPSSGVNAENIDLHVTKLLMDIFVLKK